MLNKRLKNTSEKAVKNALERKQPADILTNFHQLTDEQDVLFLVLLIYTSTRQDEVPGPNWENIDFKYNLIHVRRGSLFNATCCTSIRLKRTPHSARSQCLLHSSNTSIQRLTICSLMAEANNPSRRKR